MLIKKHPIIIIPIGNDSNKSTLSWKEHMLGVTVEQTAILALGTLSASKRESTAFFAHPTNKECSCSMVMLSKLLII